MNCGRKDIQSLPERLTEQRGQLHHRVSRREPRAWGVTAQDPHWGLAGFYTLIPAAGLVRVGDTVRILSSA